MLELPPEIRTLIYDFCFPPPGTLFQLIPYHNSIQACKLNLPLSAYLVCKTIYHELPRLSIKLRSLDLLYIIHGTCLDHWSQHESQSISSSDPAVDRRRLYRFLRFAERVRLFWKPFSRESWWTKDWCTVTFRTPAWIRHLPAKSRCALRVLEVDISAVDKWDTETLRNHVWPLLRAIIIPPTVPRLEIRWILKNDSGSERLKDYAARLDLGRAGRESDMGILADMVDRDLAPFDMFKAGNGRIGSVLVPKSELQR